VSPRLVRIAGHLDRGGSGPQVRGLVRHGLGLGPPTFGRYPERRILCGARPGGVTLLHDGKDADAFPKADRYHTIAAVPRIVRSLKADGYGFLTLPELMEFDADDNRPI
jgi:peptidoglycan/xylan/chitin deacetylase (PgdA/CDA1 family)